jgi:glycerate-2-kinase
LSVDAARRLVENASTAGPGDLVIVGVSGGGSALLTLPAAGIALDDLATTTGALLKCGATIDELNVVRRHLSAVKGGRLAETLAGAGAVLTLVISDVVGDDLNVIASGPMVPDPTTFADAVAVLDKYSMRGEMPAAVVEHLLAGVTGAIDDTPDGGPVFARQSIALVATAADAAAGAADRAGLLGWEPNVVTTALTGEARDVAVRLAAESREISAGQMLIYAGETTVTVAGDGTGGRNQELALAASIELAGDDGVVLLSGHRARRRRWRRPSIRGYRRNRRHERCGGGIGGRAHRAARPGARSRRCRVSGPQRLEHLPLGGRRCHHHRSDRNECRRRASGGEERLTRYGWSVVIRSVRPDRS